MLSGFLLFALLWFLSGVYSTLILIGGIELAYARKMRRCVKILDRESWRIVAQCGLFGPLNFLPWLMHIDMYAVQWDWTLACARGVYAKHPPTAK